MTSLLTPRNALIVAGLVLVWYLARPASPSSYEPYRYSPGRRRIDVSARAPAGLGRSSIADDVSARPAISPIHSGPPTSGGARFGKLVGA